MSGLHLSVVGDGPAIVCTHGFGDDSSTFDAQVRHLSTDHRVVTWDLPGHGRSPIGPEPATRETALAGLDGAVAAAGPAPVVLVGHSLGGYLSLCRAVLRPEGLAALVLISTGPGFRDAAKREAWNTTIASYVAERGIPTLAAGMGEQPDSLVLDGVAAVTAPVLLVVGGRDRAYHRGNELLERSLTDARLLVVEGAGHFPHRTHADQVNAAIDDLLSVVRG